MNTVFRPGIGRCRPPLAISDALLKTLGKQASKRRKFDRLNGIWHYPDLDPALQNNKRARVPRSFWDGSSHAATERRQFLVISLDEVFGD